MAAFKIGAECAPATLAKLDQRTKEARLMRQTRAELVRHVGGKPSAVQVALIEQAVQLRLRLALFDRKFAETGEMPAHDSRTYLAWMNSFTRLLRQLGTKGAAERPPSLAEIVASAAPANAQTPAHRAAPDPARLPAGASASVTAPSLPAGTLAAPAGDAA